MPGVDEAAIRAAIDAGVRAALVALNPHDASEVSGIPEDSYPDWNEYVDENGIMEEAAYMAALSGAFDQPRPTAAEGVADRDTPAPSRLRLAARGEVAPLPEDNEPDEPYAVNMPLPASSTGAGFTPNDSWLAAQLARMPRSYLSPKPPAVALEAWAEVV